MQDSESAFEWLSRYGGRSLRKLAERRAGSYGPDEASQRQLSQVRRIVVHGSGFAAGNAELFRWYHQVVNGWADIGYHFVIGNGRGGYSLDGGVERGRDTTFEGAHVRGMNRDSLGICLVTPNNRKARITDLQSCALDTLLARLAADNGLEPESVRGHGELVAAKAAEPPIDMGAVRRRLAGGLARRARTARQRQVTFDTRRLLKSDYRVDPHNVATLLGHWERHGVERLVAAGHWGMEGPTRRDGLARFVATAQSKGFTVLLYTGPFGAERRSLVSERPELAEWQQRGSDGRPITYGGLPFFCPNSPYLEAYRGPLIKEVLEHASFDGVFLDIPWFLRGACSCPYCKEAAGDGARRDRAFKRSSVRRALGRLVLELRDMDPGLVLAANAGAPGTPNELPWTGADPANLSGLFDELVTELSPHLRGADPSGIGRCVTAARNRAPGCVVSHAADLDSAGDSTIGAIAGVLRRVAAGMWFSSPQFRPGGDPKINQHSRRLS